MPRRRTRKDALWVTCPYCGAYEWRACIGVREQPRKSFHLERHNKVRELKKAPRRRGEALQ